MSIETKLRKHIMENFLFTDDEDALDNSDSFLDGGVVDSTGIMEVIFYVEEEFGLEVEDHEMVPENLDSIDALVAFVQRKKSV